MGCPGGDVGGTDLSDIQGGQWEYSIPLALGFGSKERSGEGFPARETRPGSAPFWGSSIRPLL